MRVVEGLCGLSDVCELRCSTLQASKDETSSSSLCPKCGISDFLYHEMLLHAAAYSSRQMLRGSG